MGNCTKIVSRRAAGSLLTTYVAHTILHLHLQTGVDMSRQDYIAELKLQQAHVDSYDEWCELQTVINEMEQQLEAVC